MPPIFSIITPVYNASPFIRKAILSLKEQCTYEWELLAINDASTDNSLTILKEFANYDPRIRIIKFTTNRGQGVARNLAIQKAKGRYILFLDADDYLAKNALLYLFNAVHEKPKQSVFIWGYISFNDHNNKTKEYIPQKVKKKTETPLTLGMVRADGFSVFPWVYIVKRTFIEQHQLRFSEGIYFEDIVFTSALLFYAKKVIVLPFVGYHYRKHKTSVTGKTSPQKIFDKFTAFDHLKTFLNERRVYSQYEQLYIARFLTFCVFTCFTEYFSLSKKERNPLLDDYMLRIRKSAWFNTENLRHIRTIALSLNRKTDKEVQQMYLGAYTGLKAIKKRYRFYRLLVRSLQKINRLRQ